MSEWSEWFVYRADCAPLGPLRTVDIADAILAGRLSPDTWIAAPGSSQWVSAMNVPDIARLVDGMPTRRHDSGMRVIRGGERLPPRPIPNTDPPPATLSAPPSTQDESVPTERAPAPRGPDGFPLPPPSSSPTPPGTRPPTTYVGGGETLESVGASRKKKARGA